MALKCMGIDVDSKNLETCIVIDEVESKAAWRTFKNQPEKFEQLFRWLKKQKVSRVVMEASGGYEQKIAQFLMKKGLSAYVVNPRQVRDFAKGIGKRAKTDKIDAFVLGRFGQVVNLPKQSLQNPLQVELKNLLTRRNQVKDGLQSEKNRKRLAEGAMKTSIERHIKFLEEELEVVNKEIKRLIQSDSVLKEKYQELMKTKGIGWVTAASLLGFLPELGYLSNRKAVSLTGLAPIAHDSGMRKGERHISGGRFHARKALYMPALVMIQRNPIIMKFHQRLIGKGKKNKVVIVAVMRKIVIWANAIMRKYLQKQQILTGNLENPGEAA